MPGRNDWSAGFTKSAQKTKFVRKRDVKMKDSEIRKEQHISQAMCEGICRHCIEKVQWRFKYDKYKPLKSVGNCKKCKQKAITKAYRNYCDKCAAAEKVCPSCLVDFEQANKAIPSDTKTAIKAAKAAKKVAGGDDEGQDDNSEEGMEEDSDGEGETGAQGQGEDGDSDQEVGGETMLGEEPDDEAEDMEDDEEV
jgi:ferredoxin